jgi:NTE family protein
VLIGERMLVDGGVLNNLPVDVMAATDEGPVMAVDVTNRFEPPAPRADGPTRTRRFRRGRERGEEEARLPGLSEALTRALLLGSVDTAEAARVHASLVITPDSDGVGMLEWHQLDRMREAGRRAALEALERAPETLPRVGG